MSAILTRELVIQTMPLIRPIFHNLVDFGFTKRGDGTPRKHFHFVVLDPGISFYDIRVDDGYEAFRREVVLYEESFTDRTTWGDDPFDKIALAKAYITWKTGLSSRYIQQCAPHLLVKYSTKYGGSAILDGLITSGSGVQGFLDETFACAAAALLRGAAHQVMQEHIIPSEAIFLGPQTF